MKPVLTRLPDWEDRLNALIADRLRAPFSWGYHDCALWGADVVAAVTGEDFGAAFRGRYDDSRGAALALREHGAGTLVRTFDRYLPRMPRAFARRGDLVKAAAEDMGGAIGVVIGSEALFVHDMGLIRVPRARWTLAWRVGT